MVSAEPMPHSPPMAMPNKARTSRSVVIVGANPDAISSSEYARMFHVSVGLRPNRSASRPNRNAPTGRMPSVKRTAVETTCMLECRSAAMSLNIKTMRKKSNASSVQPRYAAITTLRCFLVHAIDVPQHQSALPTILCLERVK